MDPKATLQLLRTSIESRDFSTAVGAINDYYRWRLAGGFAPPDGDSRADKLANRLADEAPPVITPNALAACLRSIDNGDSARTNNYEAGVRDGRRAMLRDLAKALGAFDASFDRARFMELTGYGTEK